MTGDLDIAISNLDDSISRLVGVTGKAAGAILGDPGHSPREEVWAKSALEAITDTLRNRNRLRELRARCRPTFDWASDYEPPTRRSHDLP